MIPPPAAPPPLPNYPAIVIPLILAVLLLTVCLIIWRWYAPKTLAALKLRKKEVQETTPEMVEGFIIGGSSGSKKAEKAEDLDPELMLNPIAVAKIKEEKRKKKEAVRAAHTHNTVHKAPTHSLLLPSQLSGQEGKGGQAEGRKGSGREEGRTRRTSLKGRRHLLHRKGGQTYGRRPLRKAGSRHRQAGGGPKDGSGRDDYWPH